MFIRTLVNAVLITAMSFLGCHLNAQTTRLGIPFGHDNYISSLHQSAAGYLVSGSYDQTIKQWDLESGKLVGNISAGTTTWVWQSTHQGIGLSNTQLVNSEELSFILHDLNNNQTLPCKFSGSNIVVSPSSFITADGHYYLDYDRLMPLCNDELQLTEIPLGFVPNGISPRGNYLYRIIDDLLYRWSYPELTPLDAISLQDVNIGTDNNYISYFNYDQNFLIYKATAVNTNTAFDYQIWEAQTGKKIADISLSTDYVIFGIHPSGTSLLLTQNQNSPDVSFLRYDLQTAKIELEYAPPQESGSPHYDLTPALVTADGKYFVRTGLKDPTKIYVYDYYTGKVLKTLKGHTSPIQNINLTADEKGLYINKGEGEGAVINRNIKSDLVFWDFSDGNEVVSLNPKQEELFELLQVIPPYDEPEIYQHYRESSKLIASPDGSLFVDLWETQYEYYGERIPAKIRDMNNGEIKQEIPLLDRKTAYTNPYPISACLSPDNSLIALGYGNGLIEVFNSSGAFICYLRGHTDKVSDLAFTRDNKKLISASFDSTIKIWDLTNVKQEEGKKLATLFLIDEKDWIVMGPNNLFDASPYAMNQMFYVVEKDGEKEIVALEQMKSRYYEPGLLQKCLGLTNVPIRSVEGFDQLSLYPKVKIKRSGQQLHISLEERGGGIGRLAFYINGKEVNPDINPDEAQQFSISLDDYKRYFLYENVVGVLAHNKEESLNSGLITTSYQYEAGIRARGWGNQDLPPLDKDDYLDSKLYVLTVGTSNYTGSKMDLKYADVDALLMAQAMKSAGGELFGAAGGVDVQCLTTTDTMAQSLSAQQIKWQFTTKENIQKALQSIGQQAKPQDIVVVLFSGHGKTITRDNQPKFHYLTHEVSEDILGDEKAIKNTTVSSDELTLWLQQIPAYKQVLIIDACHSGKIIDDLNEGEKELNSSQIRALDRMSDRAGLFIITGSAADKVSFEASSFGLGLLTYALLKGMNGTAVRQDNEGTKMIDVVNLFQYAKDEVQDLATQINGLQRPELNFPLRAGSFDIGIYNKNTIIPLPDPKPVVIRGSFQNELTFEDDLGLETELEKKYREESAKGIRAKYLFKNLSDFPDAYQVRGQYTMADDGSISLKARLIQKGKSSVELDISDSPNVSILTKKINRAIKKTLASGLD